MTQFHSDYIPTPAVDVTAGNKQRKVRVMAKDFNGVDPDEVIASLTQKQLTFCLRAFIANGDVSHNQFRAIAAYAYDWINDQ